MSVFEIGSYVIYEPGYKEPEIGRIAEVRGSNAFVCYHDGCTAASTPMHLLIPATDDEINKASKNLGHHRFDEYCPDRVENACYMCRAKKVAK